MLKLHGVLPILSSVGKSPYLVTLTTDAGLHPIIRHNRALLTRDSAVSSGFKAVLSYCGAVDTTQQTDIFELPDEYAYLTDGDILRIDPVSGAMRVLYRKQSLHNTILLTEQCNHYCLMCSQPPKRVDDSWLLREAFDLIDLIPADTIRLGISGGEPTLYGGGFIELLQRLKRTLPTTAIDVLSNGRAFQDFEFSRRYAAVCHPDLTIGIPIYSDDAVRHDYVVQSQGAFDETIKGILNLKKLRQKVELRVVIHKQTVDRLVSTCEYIARNLLFVDHVALMGLEITGFTRANLDLLWIDPFDYRDVLSEAANVLNAYGVQTSIYNHQLCTINADAEGNYRKSISDWKNEYLDACAGCRRMTECGGFFSSGKRYKHSDHIVPFQ